MISLAVKNIIKNTKNSLIVILLISVITVLFYLGNTIIGKADESVKKSYIESLTGEVVIQKKSDITMNLFGANTAIIDEYFNVPLLPSYNSIINIIQNENDIKNYTALVTGSAFLDFLGIRKLILTNGINASDYFNLFPAIKLIEGNYLQSGEFGAMITEEFAKEIRNQTGRNQLIGESFLLTSISESGFFKIRELPIKGIFRYANPGPFMKDIVLIDSQTVKDLNSIRFTQYETDIEIPDIDSIFNEDFTFDTNTDTSQFSTDYLINILSDKQEIVSGTHGDWNFILIRLNKGVNIDSFISSLNKKLESFDAMAVDWRVASGTSSILALLVQFLFNTGIFLISITGVIAIINILLIFIFRRVKEIGTLRAIGARDSFIRKLIYSENIIYSAVSGIVGIILGSFLIWIINGYKITITNDILITLFGGNILYFNFIPSVAVSSFVLAVFLGIASSVYPVEIAVKIKPVVAVQRG